MWNLQAVLPHDEQVHPQVHGYADFLRRHAPRIARRAARRVEPPPGEGRRALRRSLLEQVEALARLLDRYGWDGLRLYGEWRRARAGGFLARGATVRDLVDEDAALLEAVLDAWIDEHGPVPSALARLSAAAFGEAAASAADVWVDRARATGAGFREAALLQTIVHNLDEAIVVIEADGSAGYATTALETVLGVAPRELVGRGPEALRTVLSGLQLRDGAGRSLEWEQLAHRVAVRTGKPQESVITVRRPSGDDAIVEVHAAPVFDEQEAMRGVVVTLRDRTEQVRSVTELQRAYAELRRMNARLLARTRLEAAGELAAGVAHALNNQLNVLLLRGRRLRELPGAAEEAEALQRAVHEIALLVARLQQFAAKRPPGRPVAVAADSLVRQALELTRREFAPETPVKLEVRTTTLPTVAAEPELLVEFLVSLLLGARDATPAGGTVRLEAEGEQEVLLRITDGGPGLAPEALAALFDPLAAVRGLSLAAAREALRRWGGELQVRSAGAAGTVYEMRLVRAAAEAEAAAPPAGARAPPKQAAAEVAAVRRVLVVDDDEDNAQVLAELVQDAGAEALVAHTGAQALELGAHNSFDGALVDLLLPDMQGGEVAAALKARHPGLRIAAVSGLAAGEAHAEAADAVFHKPVDPAQLLDFLGLQMPF